MGCLICERIGQIERGENPYFVCALSTGYVVLGDHQRFEGYTLFLCKRHVTELYQLPWGFRTRFLQEMSLVAEAVAAVYHPEKMNYELLDKAAPGGDRAEALHAAAPHDGGGGAGWIGGRLAQKSCRLNFTYRIRSRWPGS